MDLEARDADPCRHAPHGTFNRFHGVVVQRSLGEHISGDGEA